MRTARLVLHLFIPGESNNQKAKILHASSLTLLVLVLIVYQILIETLPFLGFRVLGYASNIPVDEVIQLTNEKRVAAGLSPLKVNNSLSAAAKAKGENMLAQDYWAHIAPDGTEPWKFFNDYGYKYRYAGENLARDFSTAGSAVEAWMASPSHRENMLSSKYKEIGIGVVEGDLAGVDTTIIVQFFGTSYSDTVNQPVAQITPTSGISLASPAPASVQSRQILISPFVATKSASVAIVGVLLAILLVDVVVISRRKIVRIGGRTFAHLSFLGMIFVIALLATAGVIL